MGLSYDLISEFVKITNDKKENTKEGTVYATVVSGTGGKYVRIDGSDLLTPTDTTTDIEDGERVTLMIKDHKAIVTGNVTTPSASTTKVDKVAESVNSVSDRVGTFELVVADKVSTNELEAYKATIEVLIANKATIEDLTATNAKIENLEVKNAQIENLVAEKATITDLEAVNATIENLKVKDAEIENAVIENLKATTADIKILNADFAQIKTLVNGNLTSDNILSFNLTSGKVTVDDAFIKDAMIDTVNAAKINAGRINTSSVSIGSEDGGMIITGSTQQFTDKNGNVRIQIGKDASGDFTFVLYGEDGTGQLINQNGITASAISDGLIVNDMVSDNAAISGGKLDISSVIFEINNDTSTTIKSSKIYLNEQAQSLEVAFNSLKTKVDTIQEVTIQGDLTAIVEQVQSNTSKIEVNKDSINTLISQDTVIKKQVTDLQGTVAKNEETLSAKYTSLSQNLDGFKTTVADTYATKSSVTDVVDNIEANYSTTSVMNSAIEQKAQEISASVSSTYATKNQVNTLDNNLKSNYSTTQQMESAINIAKEEINLGVSSIYETKTNVESKVNGIQIGGRNLARQSNRFYNGSGASGITSAVYNDGSLSVTAESGNGNWYRDFIITGEGIEDCFNEGDDFTISFIASSYDTTTIPYIFIKEGMGYYPMNGTLSSYDSVIYYSGKWKKENSMGIHLGFKGIVGTITFRKWKIEKGNKPTDWSPAPEDVSSDISTAKQEAITSANNTLTSTISNYYTKSQTDSQINVAKEEINLGVSSIYETKTNAESKVTSTLNSAKSYADTKKSEAISTAASDATSKANTAKQEAIISANNTLSTTISNYYTKSQTDSQINVAKEEINLGVSSIYETKTNVESKVNGIQIGGRNLARQSNRFYNGSGGSGITSAVYNDGSLSVTAESGNDGWYKEFIITSEGIEDSFNEGDDFTISFIASSYDTTTIPDIYIKEGMGYYPMKGTLSSYDSVIYYSGKWKKENSILMHLGFGDVIGTITFRKWKIEKGNKPTDWTPAPEDVSSDISTAKQEAITSANNTLTSTISNYYTKSQTDSQINVAKEAINLSVSNTYETKTNVETNIYNAINNIQIGGRNLARQSNRFYNGSGGSGITSAVYNDGSLSVTAESGNDGWYKLGVITSEGIEDSFNEGDDFTISFIASSYDTTTIPYIFIKEGWGYFQMEGTLSSYDSVIYYSGKWKKENSIYLHLGFYGIVGTITFKKWKIEKGNKPTDWSPAPEDIENDISSLEYETKTIKENMTSLTLDNNSINASVKALQETVTKTADGLANDIASIQDQVNMTMTSEDVKLEIQKEMSKGTNKVATSTGFTFDQNGLNVSKTDSEMKTQITEDGMKIYKNDDVMLTANNQGVDAKNLHATTYLIIGGNSRMEDIIEHGTKRTAIFWIGQS